MSTLLDLKSALITLLNGETWSQPFTAVWVYQPEIELADLVGLTVVVLPASVKRSVISAGSPQLGQSKSRSWSACAGLWLSGA